MTKYKALKRALESNREHERHQTLAETRYWCDQYKLLAQQAIEALAQPAQEPVMWPPLSKEMEYAAQDEFHILPPRMQRLWQRMQELASAAQPAQEPVAIFDVAINDHTAAINYDYRKHKLVSGTKLYTTPPAAQPAQEPVAWISTGPENTVHWWILDQHKYGDDWVPLYTTPPRRPWVGLMRGVRVEGDTVIISVKGGNDAARELCGALIKEMEA